MSKPSDPAAKHQNLAFGAPLAIAYGGGKWRQGDVPAMDLTPQTLQPAILEDTAAGLNGDVLTQADGAARSPAYAVPLRAVDSLPGAAPGALLGEWLLDVLVKSAWLAQQSAQQAPYRLCGPPLSPAQSQIIHLLGQNNYITLSAPTRFARLAHFESVRRPPHFIKPMAEALRDPGPASETRLAILPQHASEAFTLANRASLSAWARAKRFSLIDPDAMNFDALKAALAAAGTIMMADQRQAGLLALCQPRAKIIDIAPAGWRSATGQYLCKLFDLAWLPCVAGPPSYKLLTPLPFGARVPLSYEVPINDLAKLLETM
jgi:hypothetical protein